jgi:uroporphyrinogen decarboxylase
MTKRERFRNTVEHKKVDRPIFDLYGSPQTMIMNQSTVEELKKILGITGDYDGEGFIDERILEKFNIDTRMTGGFPFPQHEPQKWIDGNYVTGWGYGDRYFPLKDKNLDDIKKFPFPKASDINPIVFGEYRKHAKNLYENTDYVIVAQHPCYGVFELGCWMFGYDDFLYRLAAEPETVHWFFEKILSYQKDVIKLYYGAVGEYIHCTTSGDDFGTQHGLFMSVKMFDELISPYMKERIHYTKTFTEAYFQHHTCGSVYELIPLLINCGVDILNPIQPNAYQMEPEKLKAVYGSQIAFWGGVDTQDLLVNGTIEEVKSEIKRILTIFDTDGGYILSPAHCIQDDVPPVNIVAIYEAANEMYGGI